MTTTTFAIGTAEPGPGEKAHGIVEYGRRSDGTPLGIPVVVIRGKTEGPTLLIDGGIHGDELEGVLAVQRVCRQVDPSALRGTLVAVPVVNVLAFEGLSRAIPRALIGDALGTDVNRLFPGSATGTTAERIAYTYSQEIIRHVDYMITCHGGGASFMVSPKVLFDGHGALGDENLELAKAFGWGILCNTTVYGGTSGDAAASHGVPVIIPELGGSDRLPETHDGHIQGHVDGILNVMRHYNMLDGEVTEPDRYQLCGNEHIHAGRDGLINWADGIRLNGNVTAGQRVGVLTDIYGEDVEELVSQWDGVVTLIRTYPLVRGGDWICSVTTPRTDSKIAV